MFLSISPLLVNSTHSQIAISMNSKGKTIYVPLANPILISELYIGGSFYGMIRDVSLYSSFMATASFKNSADRKNSIRH